LQLIKPKEKMKNAPTKRPIDILKNTINSTTIQQRLKNTLDDGAGAFTMSVIDAFSSNNGLQKCDPSLVVQEAMKAAALKLPISNSLGMAYIVPYGGVPVFTLGYRGMIQLAMRTGQFKHLNADAIFEGETVKTNRLTGEVEILGEPKNEKAIGYFAHMELLNGFKKTIYWTTEKVHAHARKYSKSYKHKSSAWVTDTDAMCIKTVVRALISKYAPMSIEFIGSEAPEKMESTEEVQVIDVTPEQPKKKKVEQEPVADQGQGASADISEDKIPY
jgi:recombination protein RecT